MSTFVLVHGGWHGAWCWESLRPELHERGHRTIALDLPCDDPAATFETYADVVVAAIEADAGEEVVLVGHSLAGMTIPLVAARRPVRRLVYLAALTPSPGRSFLEQLRSGEEMLGRGYQAGLGDTDEQGRQAWVDEDLARHFLFADCPDEVAGAAFARLRPQAQSPYARPCPLDAFPATPATYIVCAEDRMVAPAWSREVAVPRLGAGLVELPGSHSPFLSRPAALADTLDAAAGAQ